MNLCLFSQKVAIKENDWRVLVWQMRDERTMEEPERMYGVPYLRRK
jgi:hypothetical protein